MVVSKERKRQIALLYLAYLLREESVRFEPKPEEMQRKSSATKVFESIGISVDEIKDKGVTEIMAVIELYAPNVCIIVDGQISDTQDEISEQNS